MSLCGRRFGHNRSISKPCQAFSPCRRRRYARAYEPMRGYAIGSLTVVMLAVAGCSAPVNELDEVPLGQYLEGSWSCLLQDGFFVADASTTR